MDLSNVILARDGKVSRLHDCAIDMLPPVLAHLFLVNNSQELCNEFRVNRQELN